MPESVIRRWRGEIDVPLTKAGREQVKALAAKLRAAGGLDVVFHDWLSRDVDTAFSLANSLISCPGPRPWRMGPTFEGQPITRQSLDHAQYLAEHPQVCPPGGETFQTWYSAWKRWLNTLQQGGKVGVVTHNRNIQALYATRCGSFEPSLYNCDGPTFCSVHRYDIGTIVPWDGGPLHTGLYLIRHGETEFGT